METWLTVLVISFSCPQFTFYIDSKEICKKIGMRINIYIEHRDDMSTFYK